MTGSSTIQYKEVYMQDVCNLLNKPQENSVIEICINHSQKWRQNDGMIVIVLTS